MNKVEMHSQICKELNELYSKKNSDYGDSVGDTYKKFGIISFVTRIADKVNRIESLVMKQTNTSGITMKDIIDCVKSIPDNANKEDMVEKICELIANSSAENIQQVKDESIEDTFMDLANYAIMALIEKRSEKGEVQNSREHEMTKEEFIASYENDDDFCFWVKDEGYDYKKRAIADRIDGKVVAVWCVGEQEPFEYTEDNYGTTWVAVV